MLAKPSISGKRKRSQVFKLQKFEDQCDLLAHCRLKVQGEDIGCYLNRRRHSANSALGVLCRLRLRGQRHSSAALSRRG